MINLENANNYFQTRTVWADWSEYSTEQQTAAIAQAKRDLSRALGRPMQEDEPPYKDGDRTRDEYAVYEQALHALLMDTHPRGIEGDDVPAVDAPETETDPRRIAAGPGYGKFSKEALLWIGGKIYTEILV